MPGLCSFSVLAPPELLGFTNAKFSLAYQINKYFHNFGIIFFLCSMNSHLCTCNGWILVRLVHSHSHKCSGTNNDFRYQPWFPHFQFSVSASHLSQTVTPFNGLDVYWCLCIIFLLFQEVYFLFVFACLNLYVSLIISLLIKNAGMIPEVLPAGDSCLLIASSVIFGSASLSMLVLSEEAT